MNARFSSFSRHNWVLAGEHFALRVGSFAFSMVSAHAILWFFNSLSKVQDSDPFQRFVPYVIAGGFGLLGYFVSRGLVYRMMRKERIRVYIAIVLLFEFVEIVCNFAQAVSSVPQVDWLSRMTGRPHDALSFLLYIAYSIVPVVTFVLAVVDMDLEKEKLSAASRAPLVARTTAVAPRASALAPVTPTPVVRPAAVPVMTRGQGNGQAGVMPALPMRQAPVVAPDHSTVKGPSGFNFPYPKTKQNGASGQEGNGSRGEIAVLS